MTQGGLYDYFNLLADKYQSPWFNTDEASSILNTAVLEYVKERAPKYQTNEEAVQDIQWGWAWAEHVTTGSSTVNITALNPALLYTTSVYGRWDFTACDGTVTRRIIPIIPTTDDSYARSLNDPFNAPEDAFPVYYRKNVGSDFVYDIKSTTTPIDVTITYLKVPTLLDITNDSAVDLEFPDDVAREVAEYAITKYLGIVGDAQRQQDQQQVQMPYAKLQ